jgi:hypothetical protein
MSSQYTAVDREPIWVALLALLRTSLGSQVKTIGRKHMMPPDLEPSMQPALFVIQTGEHKTSAPRGLSGKLTLTGYLFLYLVAPSAIEQPGAETQLAATQLNALKKAIDTALAPDEVTGAQTLGGLVSHCWIEGESGEDPGVYGDQAMAVIPINILVP